MLKICKGKYSCGRELDERLFLISRGKVNKGKITNVCQECHRGRQALYRIKERSIAPSKAQIAREMCKRLIEKKVH